MAIRRTQIAYRCPDCATATVGFLGGLSAVSDMLRLKCSCGKSALDVSKTNDGKIRISAPCVYCRQNHSYVLSDSIFFERDIFLLNCPYSNMDIAFIGDEDTVSQELSRTEAELNMLMKDLEAEELSDIQPEDMPEAEILPDPAVYDTLRFVLKDLEADNKVSCPCGEGPYDLRFTDHGVQAYCENCGASFDFSATSVTLAEEYLSLDEINLK